MIHEAGVMVDANEAFARIVGLDAPEELIGKVGTEVIPSLQSPRGSWARACATVLQTPSTSS